MVAWGCSPSKRDEIYSFFESPIVSVRSYDDFVVPISLSFVVIFFTMLYAINTGIIRQPKGFCYSMLAIIVLSDMLLVFLTHRLLGYRAEAKHIGQNALRINALL